MAGKYVYPMARQFFVRAVFVSTRAILRLARRCSLSRAASAASGFLALGRGPRSRAHRNRSTTVKVKYFLAHF